MIHPTALRRLALRRLAILLMLPVAFGAAWGIDRLVHDVSPLAALGLVVAVVAASAVGARALWIALVATAGCGGQPFTTLDDHATGPDASADGAELADAGPDVSAEGGQDARDEADAAEPVDAWGDAADASQGDHDAATRDAGPDAPAPLCVTDLSGVGLGDFRIAFDVVTTATGYEALANQASVCQQSCSGVSPGPEWDVYMLAGGQVSIVTTGNGKPGGTGTNGPAINDGARHHVEATRIAGMLGIATDGVQMYPSVVDADDLTSLPPLVVGSDPCANGPGVAGCPRVPALAGSLTNLCLQHL